MSARRLVPCLVPVLVLVACGSAPPRRSSVPTAASSVEIAELFLDARSRGDAEDVWSCLAGETARKRVYRDHRRGSRDLTWEEFLRDFSMKWASPALAPASVWENVDEREQDGLRILVYRQGTRDRPDRDRIEIATTPVGTGWLVAWVGISR